MQDGNIMVASLMKMLGTNEITITKEMAESIKEYVIVHKENGTYKLTYKEGK